MPDLKVLSTLRERVASLQVRSCRLAHERVVIEDGLARRRSQGSGLDPVLVRVGLCPRDVQSRQLSCAHTLARHVFERAIDVSEQQGILRVEEARGLSADLQRISHAIHSTDWTKSAAEIRYAVLQEQKSANETCELREEQRQLAELIGRHQASVEELRCMHRLLIDRIDAALSSG